MENKKPFYGRIYIHKNKLNGKCYVGLTTAKPANRRWGKQGEGYSNQHKFYRAIIKYGWDNFEHIILPTVYDTAEALNAAEIGFIKEFNAYTEGYNSTTGGEGCFGHTVPKEARAAVARANSERVHSEETRAKLSKASKGHKMPAHQKELLKSINTGSKRSEETKAKLRAAWALRKAQ